MKAALLIVLVLVATGCSPARLDEARVLLADIAAAGRTPAADSGRLPVVRLDATFAVDGVRNPADLYRVAAAPRAGLVLVPGAAPAGKDDARLVAVAEAVARARFVVLVPDLARMRTLEVTSDDARILDAAVRRLRAEAPDLPLGLMAVSFAVGPAVLAIDAGAPVDFLVTVGAYWDLVATITFMTTGHFRDAPDASWRVRAPNPFGRWVFLRSNADRLDDAGDRARLMAIAARKLADPAAVVDDLVRGLGAEGRAVWALLTNDDPARVPALIAALPAPVRREIRALDLATAAADTWRERPGIAVVLIHGQPDPVIPETESRAFARAVGPERAHLHLVPGLGHVETEGLGVRGSLELLEAAYRVLGLRDRTAGPDAAAQPRSVR